MKTPPHDLDEGTIRRIDWQELCPAVLLPQAVSIATGFRVLWVASLGVLLTLFLGFLLNGITSKLAQKELERLDAAVESDDAEYGKLAVQSQADQIPLDSLTRTLQFRHPERTLEKDRPFLLETFRLPTFSEAAGSVLLPWKLLGDSLCRVFPLRQTCFGNGVSLIWFVGVFVIWALAGAVVSRSAALQITIGQYARWSQLRAFLNWRLRSYFAAVLIPVVGLAFCGFAVSIAGWLTFIPVVGFLTALLFPIALFFGFCFAILGVGLLFGWPLAFAAVSVDGSDGFDAVSRSYSYVYQRPLQYLVYALLAIVIGAVGFFFISWFVDLALVLVANWGRVPLVDFASLPQAEGEVVAPSLTLRILFFWCWCFQIVKVGFLFGYFWVSTAIIYVILRRSVDGTPIDDIRFPPQESPTVQKIVPVKTDEKGAPEVG